MRRIILSLSVILLLFAGQVAAGIMEVKVNFRDKDEMRKLATSGFDIAYTEYGRFAVVVADEKDFQRLTAMGFDTEVTIEDMPAYFASRNGTLLDMGGYHTFDEVLAAMDSIHNENPAITTERFSIGQSIEGRDLWVMKISDNPDVDEDEPEIFFNSLIHAREPMGMETNLFIMRYLTDNYPGDPEVQELVDNREIFFLPVFNPDGYEYNRLIEPNGGGMWRKNRGDLDGVDLNRNWGYLWGYDDWGSSPDPYSNTYRGMAPFSEPETEAVRQFINSRNFPIVMNFHSYSDVTLFPWGYEDIVTPDDRLFRVLGDSMTADNGYWYGTGWELLYNTNGDANDWQYGEQTEKPKILCFVNEIGDWWDNFWPPEDRIIPLCEENLGPALFLCRIADNPYRLAEPVAPLMNPIGEVEADTFTVSWTHEDTLNPAVAFELVEKTGYERITDDIEGESNWILNGFEVSSTRSYSPSHSLYGGRSSGVNYTAMAGERMEIGPAEELRFWTYYDIEEDYDYAYVELSTDGGITFFNIPGNITTDENPNGSNSGNGITGFSGGWIEAVFDLSDYEGQQVYVRFRYSTDSWTLGEGFYADDINPVVRFEGSNIISSSITEDHYLIEGRSTGDYYYEVRAVDAQDQWGLFSNREKAAVRRTGLQHDITGVPREFRVSQNIPNPFNATTNIEVTLPSRTHLSVEVFSIDGRRIETLANGEFDAGIHRLSWNASKVSSGVYFYKVTTSQGSATKRMVLLK